MLHTSRVITVRRAVLDDGGVLADIDLATWNVQTSPVPPPNGSVAYAFFDERTCPGDVLVAVGDAVLGYVKVQRPKGLAARSHLLEINGLAVDPGQQRGGVGQRLVEAAVQEAHEQGAPKLGLRVLGSNTPARALYERGGFVVEGVLRNEFLLDGHYVDDVLMARYLSIWRGVPRDPSPSTQTSAPSPDGRVPGP